MCVPVLSATVTHPAHLQSCLIGTDLPGSWEERVEACIIILER